MKLQISILLIILSVLVVLSNGLVCGLIMGLKKLRKPGNALIMSLAVSDMLTGGILIPVLVAIPGSPVGGYLAAAVLLIGVASVCSISLDRYLAVLRPFQYQTLIRRHFVKMLIATWTVPTLVSLAPLLWQSDPIAPAHRIYLICLCVLFVLVPYMFVFMAYFRIFRQLKAHTKLKRRKTNYLPNTRHKTRTLRGQARVAKIFFFLVILFLLSWFPVLYSTIAFATDRLDIVPPFLETISVFTLTLSSLVNPFLYCAGKADIKSELRRLVLKHTATKKELYELGKEPADTSDKLTEGDQQ